MNRRNFVIGAMATVPALAAACASAGGQAVSGTRYRFSVVVHDDPSGSFWNVVTKGANDGGRAMGADVNVQGSKDAAKQSQFVDAAVAGKTDGLVVSLANPDALRASVQGAVSSGIPVFTINSGVDVYQQLSAITHVGQTETIAGQAAGRRLLAAGVTRLLTIIHEAGNVGLDQRAGGAEQFLPSHTRVQVDVHNLPDAQARIKDALTADASINGVLSLNPDIANTANLAIQANGAAAKVKLATFDLSPQIIQAVQGGQMLFAIDQQQYLQGYLPVVFLQLYKANLNTVGGGQPVLTGPGYVTRDNAAKVLQLVNAGTR
jgi:simple sugar transport system substrate-binding protein